MINKKIKKNLNRIVSVEKLATGISIVYGKNGKVYYNFAGTKSEKGNLSKYEDINVNINTIYDLSSISKFFTLIVVLKIVENSLFTLSDKIFDIDSRFVNLKNISIQDILSYQIELRTSSRLENTKNIKELDDLLFNVTYLNNVGVYSDLPAMILRIIVEKVTKCDFWNLIQRFILEPCEMKNTFINIPQDRLQDCISNNYEMRIINNELKIFDTISLGKCNDSKARMFPKNKFAGHAGIFSTIEDMGKLCDGFLNYKILQSESISQIGLNRTGIRREDGTYTKHFGLLAYVKHPIRENSEVHPLLSDKSFAFGGYTGNQLTIDPVNKMFLFMASNRCHNRITQIIPTSDIPHYIQIINDIEYVNFNDKKYKFSKNFVYRRDDLIIDIIVNDLLNI